MKNLINCPDCGNPTSKSAANCPRCGKKLKRTATETLAYTILAIGLIIGIGWLIGNLS